MICSAATRPPKQEQGWTQKRHTPLLLEEEDSGRRGNNPAKSSTGATKTHIVVPVVRVVPVAVGAPAVISLIVPRAAAQDM